MVKVKKYIVYNLTNTSKNQAYFGVQLDPGGKAPDSRPVLNPELIETWDYLTDKISQTTLMKFEKLEKAIEAINFLENRYRDYYNFEVVKYCSGERVMLAECEDA